MPGAQVTSLEIVNLEDDSKELQLKTQWEAQGFATSAGKRLIVNDDGQILADYQFFPA